MPGFLSHHPVRQLLPGLAGFPSGRLFPKPLEDLIKKLTESPAQLVVVSA